MKHLAFIFPFVAWIVSGILTVLDWVAVRELVVAITVRATETVPFEQQVESGFLLRWIIPAIDRFAILGCGVIGLALVIAFDYVYRRAQAQGVLLKRFARITAVQVVVYVLCKLAAWVLV